MCCDFVHFQLRFVFGIVVVTVAVGFAVAIRYKKMFNHGLILTFNEAMKTTENDLSDDSKYSYLLLRWMRLLRLLFKRICYANAGQ